jgi:hypothetical protein
MQYVIHLNAKWYNLEENIMTTPIYLDYNATTPIDPAVVDAMLRVSFTSGVSNRRG